MIRETKSLMETIIKEKDTSFNDLLEATIYDVFAAGVAEEEKKMTISLFAKTSRKLPNR